MRNHKVMALLAAILCSPAAWGQDVRLATDPESAGPDFIVQGEYQEPAASDKPVGVQVVARGGGNFRARIYPGGLPGAGWDKSKTIDLDGRTEGQKTVFNGSGCQFTIADSMLIGSDNQQRPLSLKRVVRKSPTLGAKPSQGAIVLFDGANLDAWIRGRIENGLLAAQPDPKVSQIAPGPTTKKSFTDYFLHLEYILPYEPYAGPGDRGNSGVYLQHRYELQTRDSFGMDARADETGAIYTLFPPEINMSFPPLYWQTWDILFKAPIFYGGKKTANAVVSVLHNGVKIHENREIGRSTEGGWPETEAAGPLMLQDHKDPVFFRNIWLVEGTNSFPADLFEPVKPDERWKAPAADAGLSVEPEAHNILAPEEQDAGWKLLFNGKDFENWSGHIKPMENNWIIEDDALSYKYNPKGALGEYDVLSDSDYDNFVLAFDWRIAPGGNSGLLFRAAPQAPYLTGLEMQIMDNATHPQGNDPWASAGSCYLLFPSTRNGDPAASYMDATRPGYNKTIIIANGPHIEFWMNGFKIVDFIIGSDEWKSRLASGKFQNQAAFLLNYFPGNSIKDYGVLETGRLLFQGKDKRVWFRNIKIRPLPAGAAEKDIWPGRFPPVRINAKKPPAEDGPAGRPFPGAVYYREDSREIDVLWSGAGPLEIEVRNLSGKVLARRRVSGGRALLPAGYLERGVYFVTLKYGGQESARQVAIY